MSAIQGSEVKTYLGVQGSGDDAIFDSLAAGAEQFFYTMIERPNLEKAVFSETRHGNGRDMMLLRHWPIRSITSVVINGIAVPASAISFGSDDLFTGRVVYLASPYTFIKGRQNVIVQGTAGYDVIPLDIKQTMVEIAGRLYQRRKRLDEQSKVIGGETVTFSTKDLTDFGKKVIDFYSAKIPLV